MHLGENLSDRNYFVHSKGLLYILLQLMKLKYQIRVVSFRTPEQLQATYILTSRKNCCRKEELLHRDLNLTQRSFQMSLQHSNGFFIILSSPKAGITSFITSYFISFFTLMHYLDAVVTVPSYECVGPGSNPCLRSWCAAHPALHPSFWAGQSMEVTRGSLGNV